MRWLHRRQISRHKLRGGRLHSWFGDRILEKALWKPTRASLARAWLVGFPITMVPFLPGQSILACIAALLVRGNLLLCIGIQFLSNAGTAAVQLPASYFVGEVVRHGHIKKAWHHAIEKPRDLMTFEAAKSLYLGAFIIGILGGTLGYAVLQKTWRDAPVRPRNPNSIPPFRATDSNAPVTASGSAPPVPKPGDTPVP
jgi:uncharacterized protein